MTSEAGVRKDRANVAVEADWRPVIRRGLAVRVKGACRQRGAYENQRFDGLKFFSFVHLSPPFLYEPFSISCLIREGRRLLHSRKTYLTRPCCVRLRAHKKHCRERPRSFRRR